MNSQQVSIAACETVGLRLRQARLAANRSIGDIADTTKISSRYLIALEQGELATLPSRIHVLGFARSFARAVGLCEEDVLAALRMELAAPAGPAALGRIEPRRHRLGGFSGKVRSLIGIA